MTALLVRPKNRAADVATGAITGFLVGATGFTVGWGWLFASGKKGTQLF